MKQILIALMLLFSIESRSQSLLSNVEFEGQKALLLSASEENRNGSGKLSTGETIKSGCDHGACHIRVEYKDRQLQKSIGDDIQKLSVFEYDFGNDGDKEIVVVNEYANTAFLYIYSYGRGMIEKLFEREIMSYRIVVKPAFIEYYLPSGLAEVWTYYQGKIWEMKPVQLSDY